MHRYGPIDVSILLVLGVAVSLSMDAFAVTMGFSAGAAGLTTVQALRMAFAFGAFQFVMPILGWLAGDRLVRFISGIDHWIAFVFLAFVGGRMIWESFHGPEDAAGEPGRGRDRTRGTALLVLAVATSIDAFAVGLGLGALRVTILYPAAVIGVVCFAFTMIGARLGPLLGRAAGKRAEVFGGLVLIGIGVKILVDHLRG